MAPIKDSSKHHPTAWSMFLYIILEYAPGIKKGAIKMRGEYQTQMYCISETNAAMFELKMNETLKTLKNPEIHMDTTKPFTAYIFYHIEHNIPESVIEALAMIEGSHHYCAECPFIEKSEDKRRKWKFCNLHNKKVKEDSVVCIEYYKHRDMLDLKNNAEDNVHLLK